LSDSQRDEIDASLKDSLRQLNSSIRNLADAEQLRQNTELVKARRKYGGHMTFKALSSWAAGGNDANAGKSKDQVAEEGQEKAIATYREGVLWYLRNNLQDVASQQATMMETRIGRAIEASRSVLAQASTNVADLPDFGSYKPRDKPGKIYAPPYVDQSRKDAEQQMSPQQLQLLEKENREMVSHYQTTLNKVK
jgi:syntaxin 18